MIINNALMMAQCGIAGINPDGTQNTSTTSAVPTMTGYTTPSGVVSSSNDGGSASWAAFDNNDDNIWATTWGGNLLTNQWIKYQFPSAKIINKYGVMSYDLYNYCKNFTLYGSNDNTNWTQLDQRTNQTGAGSSGNDIAPSLNYYGFTNSTAYVYYRLTVDLAISINRSPDGAYYQTIIRTLKLIEAQ